MSAKQAINDKLQGSVATYLRRGGVVNNQIKKGLLFSLWVNFFKLVNIWQSYKQERDCLSLSSSFSSVLARRARNFAKYSPIKNFTHTLSNKFFLICLLTAQPHLKYIATVPCNLSLMDVLLTLMFHTVV